MKSYQRRTKKIEELLGEKLSTAQSKFNKLLIFELAKRCHMDTCFRCGEKITDIADFTIDRKESWILSDDPSKVFYDIGNIAVSHAKCNYEVGTKTYVNNCKNGVKEDSELYTF